MMYLICKLEDSSNTEYNYPYFDDGEEIPNDEVVINQFKSYPSNNSNLILKVISKEVKTYSEWFSQCNNNPELKKYLEDPNVCTKLNLEYPFGE